MKRKILVESQLSNVSEYLENQGYDVVEFQHNQAVSPGSQDIDAIVVTGMDENFLGMHDIQTKAMVINASGLTAEEIGAKIEQITVE